MAINVELRRAALIALACSGLAGCTVAPSVGYIQDLGEDREGYSKFQLQRSSVLISFKRDSEGAETDEIAASSVPADSLDDPVFSIVPKRNWGVKTHLKLKHRANSMLIESLGTEIEDKRIEAIQQIGGIVAAIAKMAAGGKEAGSMQKRPKLPIGIDVTRMFIDPLAKENPLVARRKIEIVGRADLDYNLAISKVSEDAIPREAFVKSIEGVSQSVLFYSACRDVQVEFHQGDLAQRQFNLRISDPNFVQTVAMPEKGTITFHTGCGVDVTSEKSEVASDAKIAQELVNQVKAIREAKSGGKTQ